MEWQVEMMTKSSADVIIFVNLVRVLRRIRSTRKLKSVELSALPYQLLFALFYRVPLWGQCPLHMVEYNVEGDHGTNDSNGIDTNQLFFFFNVSKLFWLLSSFICIWGQVSAFFLFFFC